MHKYEYNINTNTVSDTRNIIKFAWNTKLSQFFSQMSQPNLCSSCILFRDAGSQVARAGLTRAAVSVFIGPCCPALLESYLRKCAYSCIIGQIKWWWWWTTSAAGFCEVHCGCYTTNQSKNIRHWWSCARLSTLRPEFLLVADIRGRDEALLSATSAFR